MKNNSDQHQSSDKQLCRLEIVLEGNYDELVGDEDTQKFLLKLFQKASVDTSIKYHKIEKGSIKITLDGSQEGLKRLAALIQSGELGELKEELEKLGLSIEDANLVFKETTKKNVSVNDVNYTETSNVYESNEILSGADVDDFKISSINSKELQQASRLIQLALLEKPPENDIVEFSRTISELLFAELKSLTNAHESNCHDVAARIAAEVMRICRESKRIQASGDIKSSAIALARHRLSQCMRYYLFGSNRGRIELEATLIPIIYPYINPPKRQPTYQGRLSVIGDFLQNFYLEALNACRRENKLEPTYRPQTLLELAEYMAFTERYAKRRIPLPGRQQQLIILRAQTFSQQQPPEICVDIEKAVESSSNDGDGSWEDPVVQKLKSAMASQPEPEPTEETLRSVVINEFMSYLEERQQGDCADYFALRLKDLSSKEIESRLGLTSRQRDYLQQRFKHHLIRFALLHRWELVHEWLEADLHTNLGLTKQQWQVYTKQLNDKQRCLLEMKQQGEADEKIAKTLGLSIAQLQKRWFKILGQAWDIRNQQFLEIDI